MELKTVYTYDADGFYAGQSLVQENPQKEKSKEEKEWLMPDDATFLDPVIDADHWSRFTDGAWVKVAKPKTAADCVGIVISHTSQTPHDTEYRELMQELTKDSTTHLLIRGEDLSWSVEEIPEEENATREAEAELSALDAKVSDLQNRISLAMLQGDQEQIKALQEEYKQEVLGE